MWSGWRCCAASNHGGCRSKRRRTGCVVGNRSKISGIGPTAWSISDGGYFPVCAIVDHQNLLVGKDVVRG